MSNRGGQLFFALIAATVFVFMLAVAVAIVSEQYSKIHQVYSGYQQSADDYRRKATDEAGRACVGVQASGIARCVSDQIEAYDKNKPASQDLQAQQDMAFWAFMSFVVGCATVVVTGFGIYYVRQTLEANRNAVLAAENAIIVENRPWIKFAVRINGNPIINEFGVNFICEMSLTNVGSGPAKIIGVVTGEIDFCADDLLGDLKRWIQTQVEIAKLHPNEQETFFPAETYLNDQYPRMSQYLVDKHNADASEEKVIIPIFIFGVFYQAAVTSDIFYTVASYKISAPDKARGVDRGIILDGSNKIDGKNLAMVRYPGLSRAT